MSVPIRGAGETVSLEEARRLVDSGQARVTRAANPQLVPVTPAGVTSRGWRDDHVGGGFGSVFMPDSTTGWDHRLSRKDLRETYMKSAAVRPCVDFIVRALSTCPWRIIAEPGVPKRDFNRAVDLFTRPAPGHSFRGVRAQYLNDLLVMDGAVIEKVFTRGGDLVEFIPRDFARFAVKWDYNGIIEEFVQVVKLSDKSEKKVRFTPDQISYSVLYPRTNSPYGTPIIETITQEVAALILASVDIAAFFNDNEIPQGILALGDVGEEGYLRAKEEFTANKGGKNNTKMYATYGPGEPPKWVPFRRPYREQEIALIVPRIEKIIFRNFGVTPLDMGQSADVNRSCYSADTETLTQRGWKTLPDLRDDDCVATFNPETRQIEYRCSADGVYRAPYRGEMVHFHSLQVDVMVTPDHRMWARDFSNSKLGDGRHPYKTYRAHELEIANTRWAFRGAVEHRGDRKEGFVLPGCTVGGGPNGDYPDRGIPMDLFMEFLGYWLSEGHAKRYGKGTWKINLCQSEASPVVERMQYVVDQMPVAFDRRTSADNTRRWQVADKALCSWLIEHCGQGAGEKRLPEFIWGLSRDQLEILYNALIAGDGSRDPRPNRKAACYYSKSKQLADGVQLLAISLGYRAHISVVHQRNGYDPVYRVSIVEGCFEASVRANTNVDRVEYDGEVYCFSVPPNQLFLTRRNGRIAIQGNTAEAYKELRVFNLFKPLMDLMAEKFTFDLLHEIHPGLFLELVHTAQIGDESTAVDTDIPGEGEGASMTSSGQVPRGYRATPFFGLSPGQRITAASRPDGMGMARPTRAAKPIEYSTGSDDDLLARFGGTKETAALTREALRLETVIRVFIDEANQRLEELEPSHWNQAKAILGDCQDQVVSVVDGAILTAEVESLRHVMDVDPELGYSTVTYGLSRAFGRTFNKVFVIPTFDDFADENADEVDPFPRLAVLQWLKQAAAAPIRASLRDAERSARAA